MNKEQKRIQIELPELEAKLRKLAAAHVSSTTSETLAFAAEIINEHRGLRCKHYTALGFLADFGGKTCRSEFGKTKHTGKWCAGFARAALADLTIIPEDE